MSDVLKRLHARALGGAVLLRTRRQFRYSPETDPFAAPPSPTTTSVAPSAPSAPAIQTVSEAETAADGPVERRRASAPGLDGDTRSVRAEARPADHPDPIDPPEAPPARLARSRRSRDPVPAAIAHEVAIGPRQDSIDVRRAGPADPPVAHAGLEASDSEAPPTPTTRIRPISAPATSRVTRRPSAAVSAVTAGPPPSIVRKQTDQDTPPLDLSGSADPIAPPPVAPSIVRPESVSGISGNLPGATAPEDRGPSRLIARDSAPSHRVDDGSARLVAPSASVVEHETVRPSHQPPPRARSRARAASPEGSSLGGENLAHGASPTSPARLLGDRRPDGGQSRLDAATPTTPDAVSRRSPQAAPVEDRSPDPANAKARDRGPPSLLQTSRPVRGEQRSEKTAPDASVEDRSSGRANAKTRDRGPPSLLQTSQVDHGERRGAETTSPRRPSSSRQATSPASTTAAPDHPQRRDPTAPTERPAAVARSRQAPTGEPRAASDSIDASRPSPARSAELARRVSTEAPPPTPSKGAAAETHGPEAAFRLPEAARPKSPDVRIDIGRIEVTLPSPPRAIVRQRAQPPPLSLKPRRAPEP